MLDTVAGVSEGRGCCSHAFVVTASFKALKNAGSMPSLKENFIKCEGLPTSGPGLLPVKVIKTYQNLVNMTVQLYYVS